MTGWANAVSPVNGGSNLRSFEPFTGSRVKVLEGTGVAGDPFREATAYFDEHGDLIHIVDPKPACCPCGDPRPWAAVPCTADRPCGYATGMPKDRWS